MRGNWRYLLVLLVVVAISLLRDHGQEGGPDRRPVPPPPGEARNGSPLPGASPSDPEISVGLGLKRDSTGSAFAVDAAGRWLTARHVVDRCARINLLFPRHRGVGVSHVAQHPSADLALLRAPSTPYALPLTDRGLRVGQDGFHVGYPRGAPGEVWSTLLGRRRMRLSGRYRTNEPVVAWAERWRTPPTLANLAGLSGGPTLDQAGRVVGVMVAESRRRGRVYTTAPATVRQLVPTGTRGDGAERWRAIDPDTLSLRADALRDAPSVAKVVCLAED